MTLKKATLFILTFLILDLSIESRPQKSQSFIPPPVKIAVPFDQAWEQISKTLHDIDLEIASQNRGQGTILSTFREYSSGPLVDSHIAKIGEKPKLIDGQWLRVRYRYQILMEFIHQKETLITVSTEISALKREFLGKESWVQIVTNGKLEEEILTRFGRQLFGQNFSIKTPPKGFWERDPVYVPSEGERVPPIVGPESP